MSCKTNITGGAIWRWARNGSIINMSARILISDLMCSYVLYFFFSQTYFNGESRAETQNSNKQNNCPFLFEGFDLNFQGIFHWILYYSIFGTLRHSQVGKKQFMNFPMKNCDFPGRYVNVCQRVIFIVVNSGYYWFKVLTLTTISGL
jgi:hypothetical protein